MDLSVLSTMILVGVGVSSLSMLLGVGFVLCYFYTGRQFYFLHVPCNAGIVHITEMASSIS